MKNIFKLFIIAFFLISASGCEEYLTTGPSAQISDQTMYKDVSGAQYVLNGIYRDLRNATESSDGGVLTTLRNCMSVYGDDMCMVYIGNNLDYYYDHSYAYNLTNATSSTPRLNWAFFYKVVANCNSILTNLDASIGPDATKKAIKGQTLAIRAYMYFWAVRLFAPPVDSKLGIPLYETVDVVGRPRETVGAVYTKIKADMLSAITLLEGFTRSHKRYINKQIVQGMLAEVYLTHEEFAAAATMALAARTGFPLSNSAEFRSHQNDENLKEWMWVITQNDTQKFNWATPLKWWGTYGGIVPSYKTWTGIFFISKTLAKKIEPTDVRYQFYNYKERIIGTPPDTSFYTATDKFWESYRTDDYMFGDVCWMRAAEMYLIEAEGLLRSTPPNPAGALVALNALQTARNATLSTTATLDAILLERSKELYGEGYLFFDLIRNGLPVVRTNPQRTYTGMPANDWSWIFQIPLDELAANPQIPPSDQNPISGSYK